MMGSVLIKRIYEPAEKADGQRLLIDRLWPRGLKKELAQLDEWMKNIAPTTELRKWFDHDPAKWDEFQARYIHELKQNPIAKDLLELVKNNKTVTLLYAARDEHYNHARVLQRFINESLK